MLKKAFIFLLFLFTSCLEQTISLDLPDVDGSYVLFSELVSNEHPIAYIFKTQKPFDKDTSNYIANGLVLMYENNILVDTALYVDKGRYAAKKHIIKPANFYHYEIRFPDHEEIKSRPVLIPPKPELVRNTISDSAAIFTNQGASIPEYVESELSLFLNNLLQNQYFRIAGFGIFQNQRVNSVIRLPNELDNASQLICGVFYQYLGEGAFTGLFYSPICNLVDGEVKIRANYLSFSQTYGKISTLEITLDAISEEMYKYFEVLYFQDFDHQSKLFLETTGQFSNIIGGSGIVFGRSKINLTIRF